MKLAIPKWLKKPDAPSVDLEAQLQAAEEASQAAQRATAAAQDAFDGAGTLETQQALTAAQDAERAALQHVERAERLLAAAREREAAELRARQQARVEQIRGLVSHAAVRESTAGLVTRRVELLVAYADATVAAQERRLELAQLAREGEALRGELGDPVRVDDNSGLADSPVLLAEELRRHIATLDGSDPRRGLLHDLAHWLHPHTGWRP